MEKKRTTNVLLVIMGVLIVAEIIAVIITTNSLTITGIVVLVVMVFVALYVFWFYKKPHGNLLKYTMLLLALAEGLKVANELSNNSYEGINEAVHFANLIAAAAICYCAGRLNKIKQNSIILLSVDALWLAHGIWFCSNLEHTTIIYAFSNFKFFIMLAAIIIAYLLRYKEHKLVGLIDAPSK